MIDIKMGTIEEKVLDVICDITIEKIKKYGFEKFNPEITSKEIYNRCNLEKLQVYSAMRRLSKKGIIYSCYKRYSWSPTSFGARTILREWEKRKKQNILNYQLKL